jgi:DNA polymerase I
MEFQILDVDYVNVNEEPIVRIFGKDKNGKTVCIFREKYMPYFYAMGGDVAGVLKDDNQVISIERVKRKLVFEGGKESEIFKITLKNPAKTPEIREKIKNAGMTAFEADVLFKYRYMADEGLMGMGWAKADCNSTSTNTVLTSCKLSAKGIRSIERMEDVPLKTLAFDIECISTTAGGVPEARKDPIIMISIVFGDEYKGMKSVVLSTRRSKYVRDFPSEKELLEEFIKIINDYDPDVLTGFNVNNFDLPYILERMKREGVRPVFGRCTQKSVMARRVGARHKIAIVGRVIVDSYEIVKKDFSLHRYSLDSVASNLLGERKVDVKHSEIEKLWKGSDEEFNRLVNYSRVDSVLAMNLVIKLSLIDKYVALSKISGILLQDTLDSGETTRIENYLLREFNKKGYVFPCRPDESVMRKRVVARRKELVGGYVIEPDKGFHSDVAVLDFKSMYPSMIRTFNICPTTLETVERPGLNKSPIGALFVPKEERQGIIPKILENLMNSRQAVKKKLKSTKDPEKRRLLDAKQWALKILANAFYGHMGYARAKIYNMAVAGSITAYGREIIQKTSKEIEEKFGHKIIYGDTDSVFVKMDTDDLEKLGKEADDISEHITKELPGVMELEFEKVFKRFLPLTKKRYAAWKFERTGEGWKDGIEMKGIETVRRDWCPLVSETLKNVIETILLKDDVKGALKLFKNIVNDINMGKVQMDKFVITKGMTKAAASYDGVQPHIELAKKMAARNPADAPGVGDRIGYVIIKGTGLLSKRTEDPNYVKEHGLQVDSTYYIENQLLPPVERIFKALEISKSELLGNGKQMGIMDALRNGITKKPLPQKPREVDIGDVNGFVCSKCSHFYSRVPLVGVCECGGSMLFSTPRGPAERAKL